MNFFPFVKFIFPCVNSKSSIIEVQLAYNNQLHIYLCAYIYTVYYINNCICIILLPLYLVYESFSCLCISLLATKTEKIGGLG